MDKRSKILIVDEAEVNRVSLEELPCDEPGYMIMRTRVSDTGIGMSPEDLPRIFEKGYTGYNGRLDKKSTGIGLYLCRTAADKLGHKLTAQSTVGKGSSFTIDLSSYPLEVE